MTRARISNIAGVSHVQAELIYREKQTIILTKLLAAPQEIRDEIRILFACACELKAGREERRGENVSTGAGRVSPAHSN